LDEEKKRNSSNLKKKSMYNINETVDEDENDEIHKSIN
jgi:hypothetical protein